MVSPLTPKAYGLRGREAPPSLHFKEKEGFKKETFSFLLINMSYIDGIFKSDHQVDGSSLVQNTINNSVSSNPDIVTLNDTQTLTNKDLTSATNIFPTSLANLNDTQTLRNKMNHAQVGSQTDPSYSFVGDNDTGFFNTTNTVGITCGGVSRVTISDVSMTSSIPINCDNFRSTNFGYPGNVVYGNSNNTSGMFFDVNRVNFSTNSISRLGITDTQILPSVAIRNIDGTTSSPSYSFSSATGNGMWMNSGNRLAFSILGTTTVHIISTGLDVLGNITNNAGSVNAPSLACRGTGLTTTGLYWSSSGPTLGVSVSGTQAVGFESGGLKIYGSTAGNNSTYAPSLLGYYQEQSYTSSFTPTAGTLSLNPSINFQLTRIGNTVKLTFQGMTSPVKCNTSCYFDSNQVFPTQFQQKSGQSTYFYINATVAGSVTQIILQIDTKFRLVTTAGLDFPANTEIKVSGFSVSWSILV